MRYFYLLTAFYLLSINIYSVNYYCDPLNGNMSNNGSISSPWGSLEDVFNQGITFTGGDVVYLLDGNHGFPKIAGTNTSNVEIKPLNGHSPTIERIRIGNVSNASNWLLNGLTIESENTSQYPINLIDLYPNTINITVNNCTISSNKITSSWNRNDWRTKTNNGILAKGTGHNFTNNNIKNIAIGITMSSTFSNFVDNTIQYFSIDGIRGLGDDCAYIGNSILDNISVYYYGENHYDGFQSYSCCPVGSDIVNNVIIKQNTIINCTDNTRQFRGSMQGIGCFDGMYNNWTIENNVIIIDNWHGITLSGATNCKIANNTIIDPYDVSYQDPNDPQQFGNLGPAYIRVTAHKSDGGTYNGTLSSNNTIINNLVPSLANDANVGIVTNNILLGASSNYANYFVNYNNFDLHLIANAVAIDAGTNTNAPLVDIESNNRPQGNGTDVGAYEYNSCNTNFSINAPAQTSICEGDNIVLTTDANTTVSWSNNVTDNVPFSPTTTQTYTATVGSGNCTATKQITITVISVPIFTPTASKVSVCNGDAITLTTNANTTATWSHGVVDNISFIPPHPQTYTATVTNGSCTRSAQIAINVSATPTLTIPANSSICEGESVTLNAATDGMNLSWSNGIQNNVSFTPSSTQTYIATANNFGCSINDSLKITVDAKPTFTIIPSQTSICEGETITLTTNANNIASWNGNIIDNTPFTPTSNQTYTATVTNGNCSHSEQINIIVNQLPTLTYTVWDSVLCQGESTMLNASSNFGSISWNNNVVNNTPFTPTTDQTYIVEANNNGCIAKDSIQIVVNPIPSFSINQNGNQLLSNHTNGNIQWHLNGAIINGATASNFTFTTNGDYSASLIDANGCSNYSNTITIQGVYINENNEHNFSIYPNPAHSIINVSTEIIIKNIQLYSLEGKLIKETNFKNIDVSSLTSGIYYIKVIFEKGSLTKKVIIE